MPYYRVFLSAKVTIEADTLEEAQEIHNAGGGCMEIIEEEWRELVEVSNDED